LKNYKRIWRSTGTSPRAASFGRPARRACSGGQQPGPACTQGRHRGTQRVQRVGRRAHLCAPRSNRMAACTASAAACWRAPTGGRHTGLRSRAAAAGSSPGATAAMSTSDGRSTYAAPGRPPTAARTAAASVGAMSLGARARPANLVNGRTAASWSSSWKLPLPSSLCAARDPSGVEGLRERQHHMAREHCERAWEAHTLYLAVGTDCCITLGAVGILDHYCREKEYACAVFCRGVAITGFLISCARNLGCHSRVVCQPLSQHARRHTRARRQGAHLLGRAGDHEHRPRVDLRMAEPGDAVHRAWPGHGQQHARHARQEPRRGRRVAGRLLVAEADEADAGRLRARSGLRV